jgi:hypothetical protein
MTRQYRMGAINSSGSALAILVLLGGLLAGCTSLPNTSGYTAASIQLKQAVATTGDVVEAELRLAIKAGATNADEASVAKFKAAWKATDGSLDAMVAHAQSIEQIVDAGNKGTESARQVADSVKKLVDTIKANALGGALPTDAFAFVYGEYSKHVSAKSLEEALNKFGPSMAKITELVEQQVKDARRLFDEQIEAQIQELDRKFDDWNKLHGSLSSKAKIATQQLDAAIQSKNTDEIAKAKVTLAEVEIGQKMIAPHLAEYEAKTQVIRQREKAGGLILGAAENGVVAWGVAHQQLVTAIKERKPVSVESLTAAVVEIRSLMQRWREL